MADRRIMATELEWGVLVYVSKEDGGEMRPAHYMELQRWLGNVSLPGIDRLDTMLTNGGRLYEDHGHPEYSAPESSGAGEALLSEFAGEDVVYETMLEIQAAGLLMDFELNKRVIDRETGEDQTFNTWGYHENYLVQRRTNNAVVGVALKPHDELGILGMHLATRNLFCGAGVLRKSGYAIAQKVIGLDRDFHPFTVEHKPLINLRDEPHADANKWLRMHVTSGDPNMSPWATFMKLGTTSLALSLEEHQRELDLYNKLGYLRAPTNGMYLIAQQVAQDPTLQKRVTLANGKTIKPLDIQSILCEFELNELPQVIDLTDEDRLILQEQERALTQLARDPGSLPEADWVSKLDYLNKYREKHGITSWQDERLFNIDRQFAVFRPKGLGIGQLLRRLEPWRSSMPDKAALSERKVTPPSDTRARCRSEFIRRVHQSDDLKLKVGARADWGLVSVSVKQPSSDDELEEFDSRIAVKLEPHETDCSVLDSCFSTAE